MFLFGCGTAIYLLEKSDNESWLHEEMWGDSRAVLASGAHNTVSSEPAECKCAAAQLCIHWCALNLEGKGNTGKNMGKQASKSLVVTEVLHRARLTDGPVSYST